MEKLSEETRIELLIHFHNTIREEINVLRLRQDRIFQWTSQIFLAIIGALLIVDQSKIPIWSSQGWVGKVLSTITILVIILFSTNWQKRTKKSQNENSEVINNIEDLLHCFEKGYYDPNGKITLYSSWKEKKDKKKSKKVDNKEGEKKTKENVRLWKRLFSTNYIAATVILGVLAIAMILLSGR